MRTKRGVRRDVWHTRREERSEGECVAHEAKGGACMPGLRRAVGLTGSSPTQAGVPPSACGIGGRTKPTHKRLRVPRGAQGGTQRYQ